MNNTSNSNASQPAGESQPQQPANPESSAQTGHCVFEPLRSAVHEGTDRAKAAAEKAVPLIKAAAAGAAYWVGFGVCFATVFSYTVVKELAPESLKGGCRDGAKSGRKTAEEFLGEVRAGEKHPSSDPSLSPQPATLA